MQYMKWSYPDLESCPDDLVEVIFDRAKKEAEEAERARSQAAQQAKRTSFRRR